MNGLFIAPYRQNDGWGLAATDYLEAINTQIPNLSARPIYYVNNYAKTVSDTVLNCENKVFEEYDIVFQKCLPHSMTINKSIKKNVGITMLETNNLSKSMSVLNMNGMDEICVPSTQEAKTLKHSGVTTNIKVISQPINTELFKKNKNSKIGFNSLIDNTFKFYTIAEFVERKNLFDLVAAFRLAFSNLDNVSLVIKTNADSKQLLAQFDKLKQNMGTHKHQKQEIIISERLSEVDMIGLHNACDCFVLPSYGESFCRPAAEALVLGKTPIVTDNTGMTDFINNDNGFLIRSKKCPVITEQKTLSDVFDIYNAYEHWYRPDIYHLIENMQKIYTMYKKDKQSYREKQELGINSIDQFSYENIGKKICD
jgi:glycosyltransferase involved in cell wall biosynthesis